jgi:hypothetical protein
LAGVVWHFHPKNPAAVLHNLYPERGKIAKLEKASDRVEPTGLVVNF